MYAILDDQSNRSLVRSEFFDMFNIQDGASPYTLRTCAGRMETTGRRVNGYTICSIDGKVNMPLPTLIECNHMATNRDEIPTPDVARHYPHLKGIANHIQPVDQGAKILLLLGRDIMRVHKVRKQHNGHHNVPYAQRLDLGWVIVGNACTDKEHRQDYVDARRTVVTECGHTSLSEPCRGHLQATEGPSEEKRQGHTPEINKNIFTSGGRDNGLGCSAVQTVKDEESIPPKEESNLPKVTDKRKRFLSGHAEPAPSLKEGKKCRHLPPSGVHHRQKPTQIWITFNSNARHQEASPNRALLTGLDLTTSLPGALIRFRKEPNAISFSQTLGDRMTNWHIHEAMHSVEKTTESKGLFSHKVERKQCKGPLHKDIVVHQANLELCTHLLPLPRWQGLQAGGTGRYPIVMWT
ncbi:hypothetical protein FKM82_015408 [Ascaphus truei]